MEKVRVYELAKELNTTSKRLMEKLAEININVKNHMSFLEEHELEALYNHIGVIRHDEKSEAEDKKTSQTIPMQPKPEARKETRNAPRIIRTTEIIINTGNEEKDTTGDIYRKDDIKGPKSDRKSEYIRSSDDNSGLLTGFVRKSKDDYIATLSAIQKNDRQKQAQEASADNAAKAPVPADKKAKAKNEKARVLPAKSAASAGELNKTDKVEEQKAAKSAPAAAKEEEKAKAHDDTAKTDSTAKHGQELKTQAQTQKTVDAGTGILAVKPQDKSAPAADRQKTADKQQSSKGYRQDEISQGDKQRSAKAQSERPQNQGFKPRGDRPEVKPQSGSGTRPGVKPLDIPKPDFAIAQKEEMSFQRSESRRDFNERDLDRDIKREQKKETFKSLAVKPNKKLRPTHIGLAEKKGVSEILSEDFILNEFYDDVADAKKKKIKVKKDKGAAEKQAPPKAVLMSVKIPDSITVKDLAEALKKTATEVIKKLMSYGVMATLNQEIDYDTAAVVAEEFGVKAEKEVVVNEEDILFDDNEPDNPEDLVPRPPVVVVMGHVDHGKTSLLDAIRSTNVTESEAGGITQHIGAYMVNINGRNITFLDTPGHEAFTSMRARGAQVTDIAILVVAADDGVMPQTVEAINHAKAANVSVIVAINKIDKPGANPEKVKQELMQHGLVPEEWGGDVICVNVSAKKRQNIDQLLEMILLAADVLELKANPKRQAKGTVIEAKLDKNKGPLATMLVQRGTLKVGDSIVTGTTVGRIRSMMDDKGNPVKSAGPSTPVEVLGLPEVPEAGELFYVIKDEKLAKHLVEKRKLKQKEQQLNTMPKVSLEDLFKQIQEGKVKELNLIVKADVQGSVEALKQSFEKLSNDEVRVKVIHGAVGTITETDVTLASVSNAIIIGFNVRPGTNVAEAAKNAGVDIKLYSVIYNAIDDMEAAMKGMLEPTYKEVVLGHAEVRQIFKVSGVGTIAGCYVLDGKIGRNSDVRVIRDGIVVHEGKLASLKRFKDDVREVVQGFECGMSIEKFNDIKEMDIIESYTMEEVAR